jgi:hypothetical protein
MTITQIVLASLNVIAAGIMLWFASQSAYARAQWTHTVRALEQQRDGLATADWLRELNQQQLQALRGKIVIDESVISGLKPEERDRIRAQLQAGGEGEGVKSDLAIRQELAKLFWNTGQRAVFEKKDGKTELKSIVDDAAYQQQNPPAKLTGADLDTMARLIGPAGFTQLIRLAIRQQYPRLDMESREALNKLYDNRRRLTDLNNQIAKIRAEVENLNERRDVEKALLQQAEFENLERRREITRLQADVEEAQAAYALALGREADKKRQFEELKQKANQSVENSTKLVEEIRGKEENKHE